MEDDEEVEGSARWLSILLLVSIASLWLVDSYWLCTRFSEMPVLFKVNNAMFFLLGPLAFWEYMDDLRSTDEHKQQ
jgi:hypothetical protein